MAFTDLPVVAVVLDPSMNVHITEMPGFTSAATTKAGNLGRLWA